MSEPTLRVMQIVEGTSVDGPGLRTSVYLAGCNHHCPGCHNPQTWPMDAGHDMTLAQILEIIDYNGFNVTLTGGDPIYQAEKLLPLVKEIRRRGFFIWLYTGFTFEELQKMPQAAALFPYLEAIIDGPFIEALKDSSLHFRGSSNQRIIPLT